jgi:hypothetical protein
MYHRRASKRFSRPFRPREIWPVLDPGHRPSASALGWVLPARWAGFVREASGEPPGAFYHTRQAFSLTMGDLGAQWKACWNSGMFETTPMTR